jgi:hypothetical protein
MRRSASATSSASSLPSASAAVAGSSPRLEHLARRERAAHARQEVGDLVLDLLRRDDQHLAGTAQVEAGAGRLVPERRLDQLAHERAEILGREQAGTRLARQVGRRLRTAAAVGEQRQRAVGAADVLDQSFKEWMRTTSGRSGATDAFVGSSSRRHGTPRRR